MFFKIGECYLNTQEMSLRINEQSILLEPKVFAVLMYFIEHNDRYISMEELHENLWQGRCVSDAAVRRIISKIRIVLNDDHKEPTYLQSLPKRGYKLICPVSQIAETSTSEETEKPISVKNNDAKKNKRFLFIVIATLFLFSLTYFIYKNIDKEVHVVTKVIDSVISDKKTLTVSNDGKYIAFTSKFSHEKDYHIYLKNQKNEVVKVLVDNTKLPLGLAFSNDNRHLYFSDNVDGVALLKLVDLKDEAHKTNTLVSDFYFIADVFTDSSEENVVYFSGQKSQQSAMLIYKLNLEGDLEEITSVAQKGAYDTQGSISPGSGKLAVLRAYSDRKRSSIRVLDLKSGRMLFNHTQNSVIYDVLWFDEEHIILLDSQKLTKINIKTGDSQRITVNINRLIALSRVSINTLLAIKDNDTINTLIEKKLPLSDFKNIEMIQEKQSKQGIIEAYHPIGNKVWMVINESRVNSLVFYEKAKVDKKVTLMSTEKPLKLISSSTSGQYVLLKLQERITILNTFDNSLTYLTKADDLIGDVAFSLDEKSVLYTRKNNGEWQVFMYDIGKKKQNIIFNGYRFIRPFNAGYVLGDDTGRLSRFDTEKEMVAPMLVNISTEKNTNWEIINNKIVWSTHNLKSTIFNEVDLYDADTLSIESKTFDFGVIRPRFYVDKTNSLIVVKSKGNRHSEIVSISIQ
ncbi:winged helix-turn-helix domain-containing protein [Pseudoalteromonas sp. N1230-9]|uniref:winged helix-turn-helix domain-containing protein n=1 Tax=Pseudoalteromonas sp. N1230-9 TaxID=2907156 RepID=UPI002B289EFD|nr:winged helix-turn-helix domain-containing protein [Pseudoalteromonas sp. N1230-9]